MTKAQLIAQLTTLHGQLTYAVERAKGKTTITANDLELIAAAIRLLQPKA